MTQEQPKQTKDRSQHPNYVRKKRVRIKVRMADGLTCIGYCHVLWPDGRTSDVINDDRPTLLLTDASVEGESTTYDLLTLNKEHISIFYEFRQETKPS